MPLFSNISQTLLKGLLIQSTIFNQPGKRAVRGPLAASVVPAVLRGAPLASPATLPRFYSFPGTGWPPHTARHCEPSRAALNLPGGLRPVFATLCVLRSVVRLPRCSASVPPLVSSCLHKRTACSSWGVATLWLIHERPAARPMPEGYHFATFYATVSPGGQPGASALRSGLRLSGSRGTRIRVFADARSALDSSPG